MNATPAQMLSGLFGRPVVKLLQGRRSFASPRWAHCRMGKLLDGRAYELAFNPDLPAYIVIVANGDGGAALQVFTAPSHDPAVLEIARQKAGAYLTSIGARAANGQVAHRELAGVAGA